MIWPKFPVPALLAVVVSVLACMPSAAQQAGCPVFPGSKPTAQNDMFSDTQEQALGDVEADLIEPGLSLIPAPFGDDYLTTVGRKLLATLPPTDIHFSFQLYESSELNAFSTAGGRVYVSTKMVSFFRSEDEMAALLAHEIGHAITHQVAEDITRDFRSVGITSVSDHEDVEREFRKWQATPNKKEQPAKAEKGQDEADLVAIYAMTHAGYRLNAFADLFDRTTANKGKTGNAFLDILGYTNEANRRYRAALAAAGSIPARCISASQVDRVRFVTWQKHVAERDSEAADETGSDASALTLQSPLGSDLQLLRFSPDGQLILAVDANTVTLIHRSPLKVLTQIPAAHIVTAWFTPDSTQISFVSSSLRVEIWDVTTLTRVQLYEPAYPETCINIFLAPDGRSIACTRVGIVSGALSAGVALIDTATSKVLFEKLDFAVVSRFSAFDAYRDLTSGLTRDSIFTYAQSTDGRVLLIGALDRTIGFDLQSRTNIELKGGVKNIGFTSFAFIGNDRLLVENGASPDKSFLYSYPEGKVIGHQKLGTQGVIEVTKGNAAILTPIKGYPAGLLDLGKGGIVATSNSRAMDLYDDQLIRQTPTGNLQINNISAPDTKPEVLSIPRRRLSSLSSGTLSPDGRYLALSTATRSAIWDLESGKRVTMMRPFSNVYADAPDTFFFDFKKNGEGSERMLGTLDLTTKKSADTGVKPDEKSYQTADLLVTWKPVKPNATAGTLEVKNARDGKMRWTRAFPDGLSDYEVRTADANMVLWWYLDSSGAKREIKDHPELRNLAEGINDKRAAVVVEEVDRETGTFIRAAVVSHLEASEGTYKYVLRNVTAVSDYLLIAGDDGRLVVYHLPGQTESFEVTGELVARDAVHNQIAVVSRENEVRIIDLATGTPLVRRTFGAGVRFISFTPGTNQIRVLTADEKLHTLDVPPAGVTQAAR